MHVKPANIKITDEGTVKVLDFGLAKAWEAEGGDLSSSFSPTLTRHATLEGVILGTAAYMSPEQARGKKVDRRADIWSFGVVLWEMLTGHKLFEGETVSDVLAAVLTRKPDMAELPPDAPPRVVRALGRCLRRDPRRRIRDIWIYDLDRKVLNRLTFSPRSEHTPLWFPDSRRLAFVLDAPPFQIYEVPADGSSVAAPILASSVDSYAEAISPDSGLMVVRQLIPDEDYNLGILDPDDISEVGPLRDTPFKERFATLSPDGRYVAYESDESGRREIYIQSFPAPGVRLQVTRDGGEAPLWAGDSELFYWRGDRFFAVPVKTVPELRIGEPEGLFTARRYETNESREYDVTADGRRVIMAKIPEASKPREVRIILDWFTELERLAGPGGAR